MWNCNKQRISLRHKQPRASALCRVDLGGRLVGLWIDLLDDINLSRAADRIYAMAVRIIKNVVRITRDIDLCNRVARLCIKHDKLRGKTTPDKQSMIHFIKCHWKISKCQICLPFRGDLAFVTIDYRDVTRVGNIDKNSATFFLQLKSFGMCRKFD